VTPFRRKQFVVIAGALPAIGVVGLTIQHASSLFGFALLPADTLSGRLAFALRWMLLPGFCLLVGVISAGRRGFVADAIDGTRTPTSHTLEINLRYNQNTLEQTVLACIAWAGLAISLSIPHLVVIPAMAALFAVGRCAFWIGYLIYPTGRAFGMVLTALPTAASYVWLGWHAWHGTSQ
jgi:MAPEG family protein